MFRPSYHRDDIYEEARKYARISDRPLIFINPYRSSGYEKIYSVKTLPLSVPVGVAQPSDKPTWSVNPLNQELWELQKRGYQAASTGVPQEDERMKGRIKELYSLLTPYQKKTDSTSGNTQTAVEKQEQAKQAVADATGHSNATDEQKNRAVEKAVPLDDNIQKLNENMSTLSDALKQFTSAIAVQPFSSKNRNIDNPSIIPQTVKKEPVKHEPDNTAEPPGPSALPPPTVKQEPAIKAEPIKSQPKDLPPAAQLFNNSPIVKEQQRIAELQKIQKNLDKNMQDLKEAEEVEKEVEKHKLNREAAATAPTEKIKGGKDYYGRIYTAVRGKNYRKGPLLANFSGRINKGEYDGCIFKPVNSYDVALYSRDLPDVPIPMPRPWNIIKYKGPRPQDDKFEVEIK